MDIDAFTDKHIERAGYTANPLEDGSLADYNVVPVKVTELTIEALKETGLDQKSILRCKNMFALGMIYWMFEQSVEHTEAFFDIKFGKKPAIASANKMVLRAGYNYAANVHALATHFKVAPATIEKGKYRTITGNKATAWGLLAAAEKAGLPLFCGSYPITPATDILHELALRRDLGAKTYQAEDEIGGICTAIGASYAGNFACTTTSGPGLALKSEACGLAVMAELPLVIVDVQRGGPSTGLPTKTEQSDLLQALYGRNGECPMPVIAASTSGNCFDYAFMAGKIALEHMTPVVLLTDGFLANGAQPWLIPSMAKLPEIKLRLAKEGDDYKPYARDPETLARTWALPGTTGLEHRIGGLEKMNITGTISYVPEKNSAENIEAMLQAIEHVKTGQITYAVRDTRIDDKEIHEGDMMGIGDHGILAVGKDRMEVAKETVAQMVDDESEVISIYYGADTEEAEAEELATALEEAYPDCDVELNAGGQPIYYYVISVE